ncbi:hypothetical protein N8Z33_00915 [Flavobacteriaceae bacterium]|nr:hypothetical protein [Flavobacteriaceae bacterium]MDC1285228.1 hypothetical protein [Flavobacteriaceae bacterium]
MNPNLIIKEVSEESLIVGKKVLRKNMDGNWEALTPLSDEQREAVADYLFAKGESSAA